MHKKPNFSYDEILVVFLQNGYVYWHNRGPQIFLPLSTSDPVFNTYFLSTHIWVHNTVWITKSCFSLIQADYYLTIIICQSVVICTSSLLQRQSIGNYFFRKVECDSFNAQGLKCFQNQTEVNGMYSCFYSILKICINLNCQKHFLIN